MNYSAYNREQQLGLESATKLCLYTVPLHFGLDMPCNMMYKKGRKTINRNSNCQLFHFKLY
jgi:hypothetical protein